jgi:ubiquinone/menaquinone biosynthesis C-methylase UbiE
MKPETVSLLCNPFNHEPLRLVSEQRQEGGVLEWLAGEDSGQMFPIQSGIPIFLKEEIVTGANKRYQKLYDRIARWYDIFERIGARLTAGGQDRVRHEVVKDIAVRSGDRVLEVSIGTGINLRYLPGAADFFGLDISLGMLRRCLRNLTKWKRQAELFQGTAEQLPFKDAVFDVVFHFGGINYFNDRTAAVSEMIRVAKPGTTIFIGDETKDLAKSYQKVPGMKRYYSSIADFVPLDLVPKDMINVKEERIWKGRIYMLSFQKP